MLGDVLETSLRPWLLPGERLLWTGRPVQGVRFTRQDILLVPFGLLWGAIAFSVNFDVWKSGGPWIFDIWTLPFLAIGLYAVAGRFLINAMVRRRTVYAVSNRRILLLRRPPFGRFRSFEIGYLPVLEYEERGGGRGTIRFDLDETDPWWTSDRHNLLPPSLAAAFDRIDEPRRVYDLIVRETERWRREQYGPEAADRSFIG
jgi:hypothetical protein